MIKKGNHKLDGASLTVEYYQPFGPDKEEKECDTIIVKGLKETTVTDAIKLFFSNKKRNAGGPVKLITRGSDNTTALVTFVNHQGKQEKHKQLPQR